LLAGHPFDTIKTRLQSQSVLSASGPVPSGAGVPMPIYRNAMDTFRIIVKEEKFIGLYKGVASPLLGVAIMNASVFGCYSLALRAQLGSEDSVESATLGQIMLAGLASGLLTAFISAPIDLIKIRQQNDTRVATSSSITSVVRDIVRKHGVRGLFRGYGATCVRDLGYGPYFFTYELLNRTLLGLHKGSLLTAAHHPSPGPLPSTPPRLSALELAISGGLAGMVGWAVTFWADVVKTRIQATEKAATVSPVHSGGTSAAVASVHSVQTSIVSPATTSSRHSIRPAHVETDRLLGSSSIGATSQGGARLSTAASPQPAQSISDVQRNEFARVSRDIYRTGGFRAFWVGIGPTMLR